MGNARLPRAIWALGFVSMFMDVSSEMIHSLLPIFMVTTLGASVAMVGVVEGIAEATAMIVKIISGSLSDKLRKRKLLAIIGYALAAFSKPLFPLANSVYTVLGARFLDRIGKGVRGAPRDALISDITPSELRGAAFGLRQSLDTVGAVVGPSLAIILMLLLAGDIRSVLWIAVLPAFLSVITLILGVKEPDGRANKNEPFRWRGILHAGRAYWYLIAIATILTLARFSEAFLLLKAKTAGIPDTYLPIALVIMNIVYALSAYPAGKLSDHVERKHLLLISAALLIAADIALAQNDGFLMLALGILLWGLHMGFSQGVLAAMVTDTAPAHLRGTAYGMFNLACGLALLAASVIAGQIWDHISPAATFYTGAGFAGFAVLALLRARSLS